MMPMAYIKLEKEMTYSNPTLSLSTFYPKSIITASYMMAMAYRKLDKERQEEGIEVFFMTLLLFFSAFLALFFNL